MHGQVLKISVEPEGTAKRAAPPSRQLQELWFSIAARPWSSLLLVPADRGGSAAEIARGLAEVGARLRQTPVTAVVAESIDFDSVRRLANLHAPERGGGPGSGVETNIVAVPPDPLASAGAAPPSAHEAVAMPPYGRVIIAIRPVVEEPLGVAIAHAVDAIVVCVQQGTTRLAAARRTIDLIGPARILGAVYLR